MDKEERERARARARSVCGSSGRWLSAVLELSPELENGAQAASTLTTVLKRAAETDRFE